MNRLRLLGPILALSALLAAVVLLASPTAPVIGVAGSIEEVWEIEDTRVLSDTPLIAALENDGVPLAYDKASHTFYCPLGLGYGETWPALHLTAPGAQGVTLRFVDDYAYDWCNEAIAEGYVYEAIAYTDKAYAYFNIVFTGLPVVSIDPADISQEVGGEDVLCGVAVSGETAAVQGTAYVHTRGAGSALVSDKKSYRIDFVRDAGGGSVYLDVPLLGAADDLILLSMTTDDTLMRDKLSWEMYASLADETQSFGARQCEYVELFVGGTYMGVYLMMEPVDAQEEMAKTDAASAAKDSLYRTLYLGTAGERAYVANESHESSGFELFYSPSQKNAFEPLQAYRALELTQEDDEFAEAALSCIDLDSILRQYLLVQAGGMSDNVYNNMYIWAHQTASGVQYRFAPWDMDLTWGRYKDEATGEAYQGIFGFGVAQRMIDLDAGGETRERLAALWRQMRSGAFTAGHVEGLMAEYTRQLNDSGAFARNAQRWALEDLQADGSAVVSFAADRFAVLDEYFGGLCDGEMP